jgi:signal transduction histidine kinase
MDETRFMGRIAGMVVHDLQNVLAVIKESAGLMDDLMAMTKPGAFKHQDKFQAQVRLIGEQVERAQLLAENLGRLGDAALADGKERCDLASLARRTVFLSRRQARSRRMEFEVRGEAAELTAEPLRVMSALHAAMEGCLDSLAEGSKVCLQVEGGGREEARISFVCDGAEGACRMAAERLGLRPDAAAGPGLPRLASGATDGRPSFSVCFSKGA